MALVWEGEMQSGAHDPCEADVSNEQDWLGQERLWTVAFVHCVSQNLLVRVSLYRNLNSKTQG